MDENLLQRAGCGALDERERPWGFHSLLLALQVGASRWQRLVGLSQLQPTHCLITHLSGVVTPLCVAGCSPLCPQRSK